jgi:acyl-CoA synthetase (AMP-forming)/AMP-acid ligase II
VTPVLQHASFEPPPALPRVSDYVDWFAARAPHAEALVFGRDRRHYADLLRQVTALACALIAAGVRHGDRVATLAPPHPDYFVAFLASASIGAIWVGLNPRYTAGELAAVLSDSEPGVLLARTRIGSRDYADDLREVRRLCGSLRTVVALDAVSQAGAIESFESFLSQGSAISDADLAAARGAVDARDPCAIVYTSGSTGVPKGALLTHDGIAAFGRAQTTIWPLSRPRMLHYFPINHVGALVDVSCPMLVCGGCVVFLEQFDARGALGAMVDERIACWASVPSVFQIQLALTDFHTFDLSAVELIVWEGAAMPIELVRRLASVCPRLATNYGMTETTSAITVVEPTDDVDLLAHSVGRPFPGVAVRLCAPDGRIVPDGDVGEVHAHSRYNMLGYWRRPAETAEVLGQDGWLRTGDLAMRLPDGGYRLVGRLKEMYKSGGYNVYPREVERALESHPAVALAAVVGVPDPLWQESGVAYVVASPAVTSEELAAYCRKLLANYKIPKRFVIRAELPLLPIGKVDKRALRAEALASALHS